MLLIPGKAEASVFPQLKNKFPETNSEISWNLSQFPELKKAAVSMLDVRKSSHFAQHKRLFKRIVHSLGVGASNKQIEIGLCKRAKKNCFSNHKLTVIFSCIFSRFLNFVELFHFPKITWKRLGFPRIPEISFKVETLLSMLLISQLTLTGDGMQYDPLTSHTEE